MTEGVKKWSTSGKDVAPAFKPVPPGPRDLKLIADKAEEKKDKNGNPYIQGIRLQDVTDGPTGGSSVFVTLFLGTIPAKEGGQASVERAGAFLDLVKNGLKTEAEFDTTEDGQALDPDQVLAFLKDNNGQTVKGLVYIKKEKGFDDRPQVRQFLAE